MGGKHERRGATFILFATVPEGAQGRTSPCETMVPAADDRMSDAFDNDKKATEDKQNPNEVHHTESRQLPPCGNDAKCSLHESLWRHECVAGQYSHVTLQKNLSLHDRQQSHQQGERDMCFYPNVLIPHTPKKIAKDGYLCIKVIKRQRTCCEPHTTRSNCHPNPLAL
jgi:hypothetical protein